MMSSSADQEGLSDLHQERVLSHLEAGPGPSSQPATNTDILERQALTLGRR